ncbi:senescence-associated protein AAF, chloroplastic isoform X1 [Cannabis sativa]|uniref:Senescence-associated protein SPA15, chloroplastic n=2 Tax=Cannabis sativa TaxID=3483 RepID=A0A803QMA7_CANSA|nr:senescence-associated protein AAF, chloroplastic isoform X1 [Cannabis sativa]XP_030482450.1 senescence-associated protein AAF, chloroplastic isoform X1 [Cannabis sativa]XP_030482451.1 senescence-associated protein AAF, chloroplastic isoform X1 [Cannabis sativa]XP_030482453.1 senescence-associated protein AAF, chloroplastic isoform X1 [Cannabis sativa]XP_030482454.1 senescence-associated protein AAF, chloroplastic isoform X1 [Cannabis sativa]XP_030482455.1 senescence-associated protein AAF, 
MALISSKVSSNSTSTKIATLSKSHGIQKSFVKSMQQNKLQFTSQSGEPTQLGHQCLSTKIFCFPNGTLWHRNGKPSSFTVSRRPSMLCRSSGPQNSRRKGGLRTCDDHEISSDQNEDEQPISPTRSINSTKGLAEACKFVYNDAKYVNERARNDIILLSRGIMRLDARARQGVAILGSEFLKLDARAREDTIKLDRNVKKKAEFLHHIATILKDKAESRLKTAADKHWSDGALEADLRLADFRAKQRAMEDALMALEFVKNIHDMMVNQMYKFPLGRESGSLSATDMIDQIMLEKNGKTSEYFPGEVSTDRITAIQEAYWSMASALSEADGIDYTDPEELELLITTLIDLDAMDGKSSVSLLAECSSSPDVNTRKALANALSVAPSMWTLGNAGMGALQRLAEDSNPTIAAAASKAIYELKKQWEIEEGDSWRFMVNQNNMKQGSEEADNDTDII